MIEKSENNSIAPSVICHLFTKSIVSLNHWILPLTVQNFWFCTLAVCGLLIFVSLIENAHLRHFVLYYIFEEFSELNILMNMT